MKALVLAGGFPQIALIKKLKKRGMEVLLADWTEHPPAEKYADVFYRESTLDVAAIEKIAANEQVDLIMTVCTDQALNTVAEVSEKLGLPCYIDAKTGRNVTNKRYMKEVFASAGIPTAKHVICSEGEDIPTDISFPAVVKPVDCNSSKGVVKVTTRKELQNAVAFAQQCSRTHGAIIEEFIEGMELTIDAIVEDGKATVLCISEMQKIKSENKFVVCRSMIPPSDDISCLEEKIHTVVQKIASAFGLKNCPMLVQMLCRGSDVFVVEFSARTGGGEKYQSIQQYSGVDIIQKTIDITLGKYQPVQPVRSEKYILNEFIYCTPGVVDHYEGFDAAYELGYITSYEIFKNKGSEIGMANSSGDRAAALTFISNSKSELEEAYQRALSMIKVLDVNGTDIVQHDIAMNFSEC